MGTTPHQVHRPDRPADDTDDTDDARRRLLAGVPVSERRLELASIPTAVLEGGDGPPLVLLHGSGEFGALWLRVVGDLVAGGHRVVAPDLPGHGASGVPTGPLDAGRALAGYALDRARTPAMEAALGGLLPELGLAAIPPAELDRIPVPTTLIWGRQDLQVRLAVAEAASARHGWPLRVIDHAGDDPPLEQPKAFLAALGAATVATAGGAGR